MGKTIAKVKLAPGNVAWYDPLTSIYLTLTSQEAFVRDDDDLTNVKKGIRHSCIILKEGCIPSLSASYNKDIPPLEDKENIQPKAKTVEVEAEALSLNVECIKVLQEIKEEVKVEDTKKSIKGKKKANNSQKKSEAVKEALEIQKEKNKKE